MRLNSPLGSFDDRDEYQVERVIVNILISLPGPRHKSVTLGRAIFPNAWEAIPDVVRFAEKKAANELPLIWRQLNRHMDETHPLTVLAMWIDPASDIVDYHVSENFEYSFPDSIRIPDGFTICVKRNSKGDLQFAK